MTIQTRYDIMKNEKEGEALFSVGDRVAYPMHGAGVIEAIEEKEILGEIKRYYVLRFAVGGMKVMVPVDTPGEGGLRPIISAEQGRKVLDFLSEDGDDECPNWNRRYRENLDKMRTGSIIDTAEVVRALTLRDRSKGLSTGERKMLNSARHILCSELVLSLGLEEQEVLQKIEQAVC